MKTIVRILFGSHLYGTATPASDVDYKSVFVPPARDILLQRAKKVIAQKREKGFAEKNVAGEVEEQAFGLQRFLGLAAEGQTMAMDMLFAPEPLVTSPLWEEVIANRHRLISRRAGAFIGYARQQANKYGIKGSRIASARVALAVLDAAIAKHGGDAKLEMVAAEVTAIIETNEHMALNIIQQASGEMLNHWEVCNRNLPYSIRLKAARAIVARIVDEYGARALQAERHEGIDWKALSHAVRVGREAIELFGTGHITFPRPEAAHLISIKTGALPYKPVAEEIEGLLDEVEQAAAASTLPEAPDEAWIDEFVAAAHRHEVLNG